MIISNLKQNKIVVINKQEYEIIKIEADDWAENNKIINRGTSFTLHKLGDKRFGIITPAYLLYFNKKTKKLEFFRIKLEKPNFKRDVPTRIKKLARSIKRIKIHIDTIGIK